MIASAVLALALTAAPIPTTTTVNCNATHITYGHEQRVYVDGDVYPQVAKMLSGTVTVYWMVNASPTIGGWHKLGTVKVEDPYPNCAVAVYRYTLKAHQLKPGNYVLDAMYSGTKGVESSDAGNSQVLPTLVVAR